MIGKGFCTLCGRRLDADPDRPNDGVQHNDCKRHSAPNILKNLGVSKEERVKILEDQGILTTPEYWDCECLTNFIHPKSQAVCTKCCTRADEQPDSRVNEVLAEGFLIEDKNGENKRGKIAKNKIKNNYQNGICPDCGNDIPDDAVLGQECTNCSHVFY